MNGVIPFNRYGASQTSLKYRRLIFDLWNEDVTFEQTLQIDLNPLPKDEEPWIDSSITINGINNRNLKFLDIPEKAF